MTEYYHHPTTTFGKYLAVSCGARRRSIVPKPVATKPGFAILTGSGIGRGTRPTRTIANECMQGRSKPRLRARFQTVCLTANLSFRSLTDPLFSCSTCPIILLLFLNLSPLLFHLISPFSFLLLIRFKRCPKFYH